MTMFTIVLTGLLLLPISNPVLQTQANEKSDELQLERGGQNPTYKLSVKVLERTATAVNYRHRAGSTTIKFKGTSLMADAKAEAKVESKQGYIEIEVEFDDLLPAARFGPEYLTYALWAISPEGRAINLGEVILNGKKSKLNVTTKFQAFGLVVTAEPYFAVTHPSDMVVMENVVGPKTKGAFEQIKFTYELLQRGQYAVNVPPAELLPLPSDKKTPLDLSEARNAVRIARWAGAEKDATESFKRAQELLKEAEQYGTNRRNLRKLSMAARQAVQTAEDARLIALRRQEQSRLSQERLASAERERQAREEVERARLVAEQAGQRQQEALEQQRLEEERRARAEAEAEKTRAAAQADNQLARQTKEQALRQKQELRKQLAEQLNRILETHDTARGLTMNMSDSLFDNGKYTLKPATREKLARASGIMQFYPGLRLEVEGPTERRADAVRDFLIQQGVDARSITSRGVSETPASAAVDKVASPLPNRKLEIILSGDVIGLPAGSSAGLQQ